MAGAGFSFTFYVRDWLTGTRLLTFEERGLYIDLLALIYERRGRFLMPSEADFCRMLGCDPRVLRRVLGRLVILGKIEVKNGVISNGKTDDQLGLVNGTSAELPPDLSGTSGELPRNFLETSSKSSAEVTMESEQFQEPATAPSSSLSSSDKKEPKGSSPLALKAPRAAAPLPFDWTPDETARKFATDLGLSAADTDREAVKFRGWWTVGKGGGKPKTIRGWRQAWQNWIARGVERGAATGANGHDGAAMVKFSDAWRKANGLGPKGGGQWPT